MPYGIPYNSPATFPVVVLAVYVILTFAKLLSPYAKTFFTPQRLPQQDIKTSSVETVSAENKKGFLRDLSTLDVN